MKTGIIKDEEWIFKEVPDFEFFTCSSPERDRDR